MSTILGVISGLVLIILAVAMGGGYKIFLNLESIMIVLGGTIAATLISFPFARVFKFFTLVIKLFKEEGPSDSEKIIARLVTLADRAYRDSVFALEKDAKAEKNRFIRIGLTLLMRDAEPGRIARRYNVEMDGVRARHKGGIQLFSFMARISPSFGLVGTLIGLINMLRGVGKDVSPETLGPSMAVALVTTLYGALLAFFLFMPASEKLKAYSNQELANIRMTRDAMLMIKDGESAREVEEMLSAQLVPKRRRSFLKGAARAKKRG